MKKCGARVLTLDQLEGSKVGGDEQEAGVGGGDVGVSRGGVVMDGGTVAVT